MILESAGRILIHPGAAWAWSQEAGLGPEPRPDASLRTRSPGALSGALDTYPLLRHGLDAPSVCSHSIQRRGAGVASCTPPPPLAALISVVVEGRQAQWACKLSWAPQPTRRREPAGCVLARGEGATDHILAAPGLRMSASSPAGPECRYYAPFIGKLKAAPPPPDVSVSSETSCRAGD